MNQGIMHLASKKGGMPVCRTRRSIMSTDPDSFRVDCKPCKKCAAIFAKWEAKKAGRK